MCDKRQETKSTEPPQSDNGGVNVAENLIICTSCYVVKITFSSLLVFVKKKTADWFALCTRTAGCWSRRNNIYWDG